TIDRSTANYRQQTDVHSITDNRQIYSILQTTDRCTVYYLNNTCFLIFPGTYGLLTSYLKVTDTPHEQEEVIIMNGCSIDSYIFGNFYSPDGGNTLSAKFRAFKFPFSNYVLFVGTVNVCLKTCQRVICGQDQYGYGRRKREIPDELPPDPNKMFEVEMTAFLKVDYKRKPTNSHVKEGKLHLSYFPEHVSSRSPETSYLVTVLLFATVIVFLTGY
ncbi:uncharacterized protein LOC106476665, partial [Limulus polyphemus]|uniref:Uncharacterized protein LOC106476665 n=1 Tax=Limulus polyphemus TaxID=6850 RepID=A0ABM1C1V3_LIMPO